MAAIIVPTHEVASARASMKSLLLPKQRMLHLTDERSGRRNQILDVVAALPFDRIAVVISTSGRRIPAVRASLLSAICDVLTDDDVERWTLDGVESVQRDRDRSTLGRVLGQHDMVFDHLPSVSDPLLWAADAVAWAVGAGGSHLGRFRGRVDITHLDP